MSGIYIHGMEMPTSCDKCIYSAPYYEALSEAIRVLKAQNDNVHYAKIVRCGECKYHLPETERTNPYCNRFHCMKPDDWFCADGEREVLE